MTLAYYQNLLVDVALETGLIETKRSVCVNPWDRVEVEFRKKTDWSSTEKTKVEYIKIFRRMCRKYGVHRFGRILHMRAEDFSKRTVSLYRSAIYFVASELIALGIDTPVMREQLAYVKKISLGNCKKKGSCGASLRRKYVTKDEVAKIISWLVSNRRKNYHACALMFRATILCGLRPIEWVAAYYSAELDALCVRNAKATNGRANGDHRILLLSGLHSIDREIIFEALQAKDRYLHAHTFKSFRKELGLALAAANAALWPRRRERISLYTARHQFAADTKHHVRASDSPDPRVIAASLGHRAVETSHRNYARIQHGRGGRRGPDGESTSRVVPADVSIQKVKAPKDQPNCVTASNTSRFRLT